MAKKIIVILLTPILILIICICFFGRFLVVNEPPQKADVIILLSGDVGRLEKSVDLMHEGYSDRMIVTRTNGHGYGEIKLDSVVKAGVPLASIIPEYQATSTYSNAEFSKEIMLQQGFTSAIVVSSNYHMRRVKYIFEKIYKQTNIHLTYVAAPSSNFDPVYWWSKRVYVDYAISEYIKLIGYMIKY